MVATVTSITSTSSTVDYFEKDGYYAKGDPEHRKASRWHGGGAAALGLGGYVDPDRFHSVLEGHVPGTDDRLGRVRDGVHEHRAGVDLTLSAPKSVSLEALLREDGSVLKAHDEAVRATLDFIESDLLETRSGQTRTRANSLVAATFRHVASRGLDPQLHTHCVIANMTRTDGKEGWRSIEETSIRRHEKLIGAIYRDELARRLLERGHELVPSMIGHIPGFEIAHWSKSDLDAFSSRSREMVAWLKERGWSENSRTRQAAALATRGRKREPHREELSALWRERAEGFGIDPDRPVPAYRRKRGIAPPELTALEVVWSAAEHVEERNTVFPASELRALALGHSPGRHGIEEIDGAIDQLRKDGHLVDAIRRGSGPSYVTDRAIRAEREVIARMKAGIGKSEPLATESEVEKKLSAGKLTQGQKEGVRTILLGRDRIVGVQGYAGTGKTAMLREVAAIAGKRKVIALAPSTGAALALSRETGVPARTLQWFLARHGKVADGTIDPKSYARLRASHEGSLLVVDEMSLASTAQTVRLMRIARRLGVGRVAMVGDVRQLRAIGAGQPFRQLQKAGMKTAVMDDILRQRSPDLKAAVHAVIGNAPREALGHLGENLHEVPFDRLGPRAAEVWLRLTPGARAHTAILAPTHALRREINEAVREGLDAEGILKGRTLELNTLVSLRMSRAQTGDARNWKEGDVAVFHSDLFHYRIGKNDACRVTGFDGGRVILAHPDGSERRIDPSGDIRYRLELHETAGIGIRAGDRIRWTRNDPARELVNGREATVLSIAKDRVRMRLDDGRRIAFTHGDGQLRHMTHAYASTVYSAQGITRDNVIAVLDSGHGLLTDQQTFYVEISRARDNAVVLTDNREQLGETLERNTGLRLTALEAIGERVEPEPEAESGTAGISISRIPDDGPLPSWPPPDFIEPDPEPVRQPEESPDPDSFQQAQQAQPAQQPEDNKPAVPQPHPEDEKHREWQGEWERYERECAEAGVHPVHGEGYAELSGQLRELITSEVLSGDSLADACGELERLDAAEAAAGRVKDCMEGLARGLSVRREETGTGGTDGTDRTDNLHNPDNTGAAMEMDTGNAGDADDAENTPFIEREDYPDWRFGMEEAVTSAREILGDDALYGPHVAALGGREGREELEAGLAAAREVLAGDDLVLGGYTAAARAEQWEAEWAEYADRAAGDGLDPRMTEAGLEMIALGRTITGDPSLPPDRLDAIGAVIADADECHGAVERYDGWLGEWNRLEERAADEGVPVHSLPGAGGLIGRARDLSASPSLPGDCREAVRDRIDQHEAHHAAVERESRDEGRDEGWKETRELAGAARRESAAIRKSLSELHARVLGGEPIDVHEPEFGRLIEMGKELSANPALSGPEAERLEKAVDKAAAIPAIICSPIKTWV